MPQAPKTSLNRPGWELGLEHDPHSRNDEAARDSHAEHRRHDGEVLLRSTVRAEKYEKTHTRAHKQTSEHGPRAEHAFHI